MTGIWEMWKSWIYPKYFLTTCSFFKGIKQIPQLQAYKKPNKLSCHFLILELRDFFFFKQ